MKHRSILMMAVGSLLISGAAIAAQPLVTDPSLPRTISSGSTVTVSWGDPAQFTEITRSGNRAEAARGKWVTELAQYLGDNASTRLDEGQQLSLTLTDIDLAGDYEPWLGPRMHDVRMVRDIYPPRLSIEFSLTDANGQVVDQGERTLSDLGYLNGLNTARKSTETLRYEKRMIDRWLQQEFGPEHAMTAHK